MSNKITIVTGANKGIGYAIVKGLCQKYNGKVYLTARNEQRGEAAVKKLKDLGYNPSFHKLDVNDQDSVDTFRDYIKNTYGGLDILINNAGVATHSSRNATTYDEAQFVINTNYFGLLRVSEALIPLIRQDGKVINISSMLGHLSRIPSADLKNKLSDASLTIARLSDIMKQYLEDVKNNVTVAKGWGRSSYNVSKVAVSALTRVQQRQVDEKYPDKNIAINSVHPGYVSTDLTDHRGVLRPDEGARAPLYLALEAKNLKGQYIWNDNRVVDWTGPAIP